MNQLIKVKIESIEELLIIQKSLNQGFFFRGQANKDWNLSSSLERALNDHFPIRDTKFTRFLLDNREYWMLREFKRAFHLYEPNFKLDTKNNFEWLAVMQHYGCATRLLDFTKSFFIALYFAVNETKTDSCVWCLNAGYDTLAKKITEKFNLEFTKNILGDSWNQKLIQIANRYIKNNSDRDNDCVLFIEPENLTQRIYNQQGILAFPTNSTKSFQENLNETYNITETTYIEVTANEIDNLEGDVFIIKVEIPNNLKNRIIRFLIEMNINRSSIFPGLEGFSKSLVETMIMSDEFIDTIDYFMRQKE